MLAAAGDEIGCYSKNKFHNLAFDINVFLRTVNGHFSNSSHVHIIGTESLHLLLHYGKK